MRDLVHEDGVLLHLSLIAAGNVRPKALEVGELDLHLVVFEQEVLVLLVHVLVLCKERLLFLIDDADLLHQELGRSPLVVLVLLPGEPLVGLEELALCLVDHMLELLSMPLQLHLVPLCLLLKVEILLQQLVPPPLALILPLRHLIDDPPILDVLGGEVLQQLRENGLLLGGVASARYLLQCDLDVLLQVLNVSLLEVQIGNQLGALLLKQQILLRKV